MGNGEGWVLRKWLVVKLLTCGFQQVLGDAIACPME